MELNHLKYFYHVVREGGFTRAAERLHIAQPSISKIVKQLEEELGTVLLERRTRGIALTKSGQAVYQHCESIFSHVENLKAAVEEENTACRGPLTLAAAEGVSAWLLPPALHRFKQENPLTVPAVYSAPARQLFQMLEDGKMEFGLFFHIPDPPDSLKIEVLKRLPFELVISAEHARDAKVRESFIGSREIDDASTRRFPTLERIRKKYAAATIQISTNNLTAHKELVRLGAGSAILPRLMVQSELRDGTFKRLLPGEEFEFNLKLVTRRKGVLSRNARVFLQTLGALLEES